MSDLPEHDDELDTSQDSNDESAESDDSESEGGQGLFDLMAEEANDDSSDASSSEDDSDDEGPGGPSRPRFHPFVRLPPELRHQIWETFCPALTAPSRIVDINLTPGTARHKSSDRVWTPKDGIFLQDETLPLRTVLAVAREPRAIALHVVPDTLQIDAGSGDAIVRFNKEADVVLLSGLQGVREDDVFHLPEFGNQPKNVAINNWDHLIDMDPFGFQTLMSQFTQLESVFLCSSSSALPKLSLAWCVTDMVHKYLMERAPYDPALDEGLQYMYCWPDLRNHRDFASFLVPDAESLLSAYGVELDFGEGVRTWPMVSFEFERGLRRYKALCEDNYSDSDDESDSNNDSEDGTDEDEYESDGIDDAEVLETFGSSSDDILSDGGRSRSASVDSDRLAAQFSSPEPESEPEPPAARRKRRIISDSDDDDDDEDAGVRRSTSVHSDLPVAHFSSPQPESEPEPPAARRKRRIVSDSDDDDEEERPVAKRARVSHAVSSGSDSSSTLAGDSPPAPALRRRGPVVLSDSESDGEEQLKNTLSDAGSESDQDSESEDGDDDEEEQDVPNKPMSLAERLRQARESNPIASSENDSDEGSIVGSEDEDDDDDDDDESEEGGAFLRMAEESDGEGDEDDEDEY